MIHRFLMLTVLCITCFSFSAYSQIQQNARIEYEDKYYGTYSVHAFKKTRTSIVQCSEPNKGETLYTMDLLNENLIKVKQRTYSVTRDYHIWYDFESEDSFYQLHCDEKQGLVKAYKFNSNDLSVIEKPFNLQQKMKVKEVVCIGDCFFVSAKVESKQVLFVINVVTGKLTRQTPGENRKQKLDYYDLQIVLSPKGKEVVMRFRDERGNNIFSSSYYLFDSLGNTLTSYDVPNPDDNTQLKHGIVTNISKNQYVISGTYSKDRKGLANGMYLTLLKGSEAPKTTLINYLDITNFTSYMYQDAQDDIKEKKEKKENKGKELNLDYNALVHDVIQQKDGYIMISEFYKPIYHTPGGQSANSTFMGYDYTHAAILAFDKTGNLKWSNAFKMNTTYKPMQLKRFLVANSDDLNTHITFLSQSLIQLNSFDENGKNTQDQKLGFVDTGKEGDKTKWSDETDIIFWYDQSFLAFGMQKVKNSQLDGKNKRKVFFVNKLSFELE